VIQPFIRFLLVALTMTLVFVLGSQIFGVPIVLKVVSRAIISFILFPLQVLQGLLISTYGSILAAAPLPRKERTGWELLVSLFNKLWIRVNGLFS